MIVAYYCDKREGRKIMVSTARPDWIARVMGPAHDASPSESVMLIPGTFDEDGNHLEEA